MALQFSVGLRNASLNQIEAMGSSCALEIRSGSPPANCAAAGTGTILSTINLPSDWMEPAADGAVTKKGTWQDAAADASGIAGHFRVYSSQVTKDGTTCFMQGTVGEGTGDLQVDNTDFNVGQSFTITAFTITAGNA